MRGVIYREPLYAGKAGELDNRGPSIQLYGKVESTLRHRLKKFDPIIMPEHVTPEVRPILSSLDAEADDCIQRMRQRFNIEKDIRRCFFATQELNAYAMRPVLSDGTSTYLVGILGGVVAELIRSIRVVSKDPAWR
jgi:hypothetical protein